jgi:LPXTG-motif cell wall-anchored protein
MLGFSFVILRAIADEREQQTAYGWYAVSGTGALVALGAALLFWRNRRRRTARA